MKVEAIERAFKESTGKDYPLDSDQVYVSAQDIYRFAHAIVREHLMEMYEHQGEQP